MGENNRVARIVDFMNFGEEVESLGMGIWDMEKGDVLGGLILVGGGQCFEGG